MLVGNPDKVRQVTPHKGMAEHRPVNSVASFDDAIAAGLKTDSFSASELIGIIDELARQLVSHLEGILYQTTALYSLSTCRQAMPWHKLSSRACTCISPRNWVILFSR